MSDLPFEGILVHAAGQGPNGFCIFEFFESEEAVERFREALGTIPQEVGIEEPPEFFPAHTFISVGPVTPDDQSGALDAAGDFPGSDAIIR